MSDNNPRVSDDTLSARTLRHTTVELRLIQCKKGEQGLDGDGVVHVLDVLQRENNGIMPASLTALYKDAKACPWKKFAFGDVYTQAARAITAA